AADRYLEVARRWPDDEIADDALLEAAQLHDEKLLDPEGALRIYRDLVRLYPTSRLVRRANNRADFLQKNLAAGAEPLRRYQEIVLGYAKNPSPESASDMEALLRAYPIFPLADQ